MDLYRAKKGNESFYIQPSMIDIYSMAGYEIFKMEEVPVKDVAKESRVIKERENRYEY